jgi:hypothetical protein
MPVVEIISPAEVRIDGANYGAVADTIANNPQLASAIQLALNEWGADIPGLRSRISQLEQELEGYRNPVKPEQDYVGLWNSFLREGISIFLFVRYLADQTLPIANAYSDFKDALTSPTPTPEGLQSSVDNLFAAIRAYGADFNQEQSAAMRSLLDSYGFSSIVFPLGV